MCIALITTAHPHYPFILLNNRDEFLLRPTAPADFWPSPNSSILGGRDLQRPEQGTWLGVNTHGAIACLTNFREPASAVISGAKSRGGLPKAFLTCEGEGKDSVDEFAKYLVDEVGVGDVGGFSLVFGRLTRDMFDTNTPTADDCNTSTNEEKPPKEKGLAIVSNRTENADSITRICTRQGETQGLSNSHFGDRTWPKVVQGEKALNTVVDKHIRENGTKDELLSQCFDLLTTDTLPKRKTGEDWETYVYQLRNSIFIPKIGGQEVQDTRADEIATADLDKTAKMSTTEKSDGGAYGTQKQTVILVDWEGKVTYVEKTLYDEKGKEVENWYRRFELDIQGWDD